MNIRKLIQMSIEGQWEADRLGLDRAENWDPLLVYIHVSRLLIGVLLGLLTGIPWGIGLALLFFHS